MEQKDQKLFCMKMYDDVVPPTKERFEDAGYDIQAYLSDDIMDRQYSKSTVSFVVGNTKRLTIPEGERAIIPTGVRVSCPVGVVYQVWPRSGLAVNAGISIMAGVIDSGYRGEILIVLCNTSHHPVHIQHGDRIAQLLPVHLYNTHELSLSVVNELTDSERMYLGFGSSG